MTNLKVYPPMPPPAPPLDFGWVWGKWVELLRSLSAAEDKLSAATDQGQRVNLNYVVEMLKADLTRFRSEVASGFELGQKFLADSDPALLGRVFAEAVANAAYLAAEQSADALKTENRVMRGEITRLGQQLADLRAVVAKIDRDNSQRAQR